MGTKRLEKLRLKSQWYGDHKHGWLIYNFTLMGVLLFGGISLFGFPALFVKMFYHGGHNNLREIIIASVVWAIITLIYVSRRMKFENEAWDKLALFRKDKMKTDSLHATYGTKSWATTDQIFEASAGAKPGIWIGAGFYWHDRGHLLTVGSNSAGKGSNFIIPCLLSKNFAESGSSFICLDPKGENASITNRAARQHGFDVHILNPFGIDGLPNTRFNPFAYIGKDDENVIEYCDMLAEMIIPIKSGIDSTAEHFDTQARTILSAYMLHLIDVCEEKEKNFATLFKWVNLGGSNLNLFLAEMSLSTSYRGILGSIITGFNETRLSGGDKEASGILSTMKKNLEPFKNFKLRDSTETSDFDIREIAKKQMGVYVCIPQSEMEKNSVWLRLVMGCTIKLLQKHYNKNRKVLFIMDEFPTLGYMREFEQTAGLMAGYNVSFWVILQLLPQLQTLYPKMWETFIANASVKHFLGIGDVTTAEYVSKLMPNDLIMLRHGENDLREVQKKLMDANEILADKGIIVFLSKLDRPARFQRTPYYEIEAMKGLADERPML